MRLDKYLADMGMGTRSEIKEKIKKGQVMVNGEFIKKPETKVEPFTDNVSVQGKRVSYIT